MKHAWIFASMMFAGTAMASGPNDARDALLAACPGLKVHAADVTISGPVRQPASLTDQREMKWKDVYSFQAKVSEKPSQRLFTEFRAQGQFCTFDVEAVKLKEVATSKSACASICRDRKFTQAAVAYFGVDGSAAGVK